MVKRINDIGNIFAEVTVHIVRLLKQLRCLVDEVCRKDKVKDTIFMCLVKLIHTIGEEAEGRTDEYPSGFPLLEFSCYFQHTGS